MTNKEFIQLSEKEVKKLNGNDNESAFEAWRAGYNYARKIVKKSINEDYNSDFVDKMEEFSNEELEEFKFNVSGV